MAGPKHGMFWRVDFGGCLIDSVTRRSCYRGVCVVFPNPAKEVSHHSLHWDPVTRSAGIRVQ